MRIKNNYMKYVTNSQFKEKFKARKEQGIT